MRQDFNNAERNMLKIGATVVLLFVNTTVELLYCSISVFYE